MKTIIIITLLALLGMTGQAQPLLKTHVETGDVEGANTTSPISINLLSISFIVHRSINKSISCCRR